jgi:hypothetical protein
VTVCCVLLSVLKASVNTIYKAILHVQLFSRGFTAVNNVCTPYSADSGSQYCTEIVWSLALTDEHVFASVL